jgi:hypothetical protein
LRPFVLHLAHDRDDILNDALSPQDSAGKKLPPPSRKTIDLEGRLIKDGVRKAIRDQQNALHELLNAINQFRKLSESKPLTLPGSDYAHAILELNKAIDHAKGLLLQ